MSKDTLVNNPLLCDPVTGTCEMPEGNSAAKGVAEKAGDQPLRMIYFTDPICSSCWGIEPQLRKLKLEYGDSLQMEYRMGGLLPDWNYNAGGISGPKDVAVHWDEVSVHYDMPIDGDVWLEDPLASSFPPSIAFKAAQIQDDAKAIDFLRALREQLFLEKKNITRWEQVVVAANRVGLDTEQLKEDVEGRAKQIFEEDLLLARELGVRGFPTIFFIDQEGSQELVYGSKPYAFYEMAILKLHPKAEKMEYRKDWQSLFSKFSSMTAREFAELSGTPRKDGELLLDELTEKAALTKVTTKNGSLWRLPGPSRQ
ncbi:MAG TPA: ClpXP adapter SpxH family protein [Cyclobacteriaceae bacterium]|nr:ClpXP adapter SpxH family protein [Cyclobacteriaceae bacterium]